jgi:hypothetical protein
VSSPRFVLCLAVSAALLLTACDPDEPKPPTAAATTSASPSLPSTSPTTEQPSTPTSAEQQPKSTEQQSVPKTKEAAIQRYEQFLHGLGKEDITTVCEIAGPGAKVAEDKGFGPCKSTYAIVFQMISAKQKTALKTATINPALVSVLSPGKVEIPVEAVKSGATFTDDDLGGYTLEYLKDNWFITGSPTR